MRARPDSRSGARSVDFIFSDNEQTPEPFQPDPLLLDTSKVKRRASDERGDDLRQLSAIDEARSPPGKEVGMQGGSETGRQVAMPQRASTKLFSFWQDRMLDVDAQRSMVKFDADKSKRPDKQPQMTSQQSLSSTIASAAATALGPPMAGPRGTSPSKQVHAAVTSPNPFGPNAKSDDSSLARTRVPAPLTPYTAATTPIAHAAQDESTRRHKGADAADRQDAGGGAGADDETHFEYLPGSPQLVIKYASPLASAPGQPAGPSAKLGTNSSRGGGRMKYIYHERETPFGQKQLLKTSKKPDSAPGGSLGHVERLGKVIAKGDELDFGDGAMTYYRQMPGGGGGKGAAGTTWRTLSVTPPPPKLVEARSGVWQPRRHATQDLGAPALPPGHQGSFRSWLKPSMDDETGRRIHEWAPFGDATHFLVPPVLEVKHTTTDRCDDVNTSWKGGRYFVNNLRKTKGWRDPQHHTGAGWSSGALAAYGQDALERAGGRGASGGGEGYREQWVPLALRLALHEYRDLDKSIPPLNHYNRQHNSAGLRSRVFTRTSHWVDFPAGKSLDGYPAGKDPVLRS